MIKNNQIQNNILHGTDQEKVDKNRYNVLKIKNKKYLPTTK